MQETPCKSSLKFKKLNQTMKTYKLEIITPEKVVYQSDVESIVMPGVDGKLGVLAGHEQGVIQLEAGLLNIRKGTEQRDYIISKGYAEIGKTGVGIYVESAELPENINIEASRIAVENAQKVIDNPESTPEELIGAKIIMEKELGRIKTLDRMKK